MSKKNKAHRLFRCADSGRRKHMEEALVKSGNFPNVAIKPGTNEHAATGETVEIPDGARSGDAQSLEIEETEQAPTKGKNEAENASDCFELDTQEQLLADVYDYYSNANMSEQMRDLQRAKVENWLDRQEEITSRNCRIEYEEMRDYLQDMADKLGHERDLLREQLQMAQDIRPDCDCWGLIEHKDRLEKCLKDIKVDRNELQLALIRFATDWMMANSRIQEQRTILYHTEQIAELIEGAK